MTLLRTNKRLKPVFSKMVNGFFQEEPVEQGRLSFAAAVNNFPRVNIKEDEKGFILEMAAPGKRKEDIRIQLDRDVLTIRSEKQNKAEHENYLWKEFAYQGFQRIFKLPQTAAGEKISARYKDGILYIIIPKKEKTSSRIVKAIQVD